MADKRDILIRLLGEETVSKMAGRAEKGLDKFGDSLDATERDAKHLDRQIGEVERSLATLAVAFARTDDAADRMDISKAMRKQQAELRKLTKAKGLLPDIGKAGVTAASGFASQFASNVGPMLSKLPMAGMNPAVLAIGAPLAIGVASLLATAVGGAIVGAVGIGGVVGGLKLASKDPQVKAAGTDLGKSISGMLGRASSAFVPETLAAIETVRQGTLSMEPDFKRVFNASARYLAPLTRGLMDAAHNAMPGIIKAVESAGPVIDSIADGMRDLGSEIGDSLGDLADYADEGARALHILFKTVEWGIQGVTGLVVAFSELYGAAEKVGALLTGDLPRFYALITAQDKGADSSHNLSGGLSGVAHAASIAAEATVGAADAARGQASALDELAIKLRAQTDPTFALIDAQHGLRDAQKEYNEAVKEHGKKSPEAQEALRKSAAAALALEAAVGGAAGTFNGKLSPAMVATLKAAGFTDAQIKDLEQQFKNAKAAGDKFAKNYQATAGLTDRATAAAKAIVARINNMNARINVYAEPHGSFGGGAHTGHGNSTGMSTGGLVTGSGPKGVDSEPRMLAPGEYVLPANEVDAAGGPGGVERIRAALRGGGGSVAAAGAPAMTGGGAVAHTVIELRSGGSRMDDLLVELLRRAIAARGGNVQAVLGR